MKFPRMDFYPWDFKEDECVKLMTWLESAAYMYVLTGMWQWADKHDTVDLPNNDWMIAGAVGIPYEEWCALRKRFVDHPLAVLFVDEEQNVLYSPRLRKEYLAALGRHDMAVAKGKTGGRPKSLSQTEDKPQQTSSLAPANPELSPSKAHLSLISDQETEDPDTEPSVLAENPPRPPRPPRPSDEAKTAVAYLKTRLQANGMRTFARDWHLKGAATAERLLRSGLSPPDLRALIDWCFTEPFWRGKVTTMNKVSDLVGQWQQATASPNRGGDRYDHYSRSADAGRHDDSDTLNDLIQ